MVQGTRLPAQRRRGPLPFTGTKARSRTVPEEQAQIHSPFLCKETNTQCIPGRGQPLLLLVLGRLTRQKGREEGEKAYSTRYSQAVSHPSTNQARPCLASEIRRDRARSGWYGRRRERWPPAASRARACAGRPASSLPRAAAPLCLSGSRPASEAARGRPLPDPPGRARSPASKARVARHAAPEAAAHPAPPPRPRHQHEEPGGRWPGRAERPQIPAAAPSVPAGNCGQRLWAPAAGAPSVRVESGRAARGTPTLRPVGWTAPPHPAGGHWDGTPHAPGLFFSPAGGSIHSLFTRLPAVHGKLCVSQTENRSLDGRDHAPRKPGPGLHDLYVLPASLVAPVESRFPRRGPPWRSFPWVASVGGRRASQGEARGRGWV